ncbi:olfactory receptor 52B4-like [Sorex araneus]|uniref:olfactory receptor 52B4-like n=1 Tax=Sorex araneus TaxID=42254 RepID=UPI0024334536|nr:olfactory receptor 52B4-like [Sorex araneus]
MTTLNHTGFSHTVFRLLGIPGLQDMYIWISIPFLISYTISVLGNCLIIFIIVTRRSLQEPMYLFLCMLSGADIILSTSIIPQALAIFWFNAGEISLNGCLTQIVFTSLTFMCESGILLVMAFDRYIAICYPLRYTTILTHALIGKIGVIIFLRSYCTVLPVLYLVKRLTFCKNNIIPNTVCKHIILARLSCNDIRINIWYGFIILIVTLFLDIVLVFLSYMLILRAIFRMPSREARAKALNTCGSHVCVILLFYVPGIFSVLTQPFGRYISLAVQVVLGNIYILIPPMLNPIIYGIKTKQIREQLVHVLIPKRK